ncbi:amidohydrolase [candidate division KSB1 bacterium]
MSRLKTFMVFVIIIFLSTVITCGGEDSSLADRIFINGKIWTVDNNMPLARCVAVRDGRIIAVGEWNDVSSLAGKTTDIVDLEEQLMLPGFNDSHTHFTGGGFHLLGVKLKDAENEEEFGRRLAEKSKELPPGAWITGGTWDHDRWPSGKEPTAALIDRYVSDRPVFVTRYDGHMSVANSMALKMAGVTADTPDPPGGVIDRKPGTREPTGLLRETAESLVGRIIPDHSKEEIKLAIETALKHAAENGFTSIHQVDVTETDLDIYKELLEKNDLKARMYGFIPLSRKERFNDIVSKYHIGSSDWITLGGLKAFIDGSLGSTTALFYEPYDQNPNTSGIYVVDPDLLKRQILEADAAGLQVAVHAIGDKANSDILDMFAEAVEKNGPRDRRFRVEHSQHMHAKDFKRYADLEVIASMQPYHAIDDGRFAEKRIGFERCKTTYAFRSFLDNGVVVAFGSDWTVAPLDAIQGIYAAVTRRTLDGKHPGGWFPEQKVTVEQAIEAYTMAPAFASFQEDTKGSITPGKLADMVVLSKDILTIPPAEIETAEIVMTILNGNVVYAKK